jgi:protein associated with RNAse G/E
MNQPITVYKHDHTGKTVLIYAGEVVERGATWVKLQARFNHDDYDAGYHVFRRNDLFIEWFYSDRPYNIFKMYGARDGLLKGWYCNVTRPAVLMESEVHADDLALDVFVSPAGEIIVLDEDEFAALDLSDDERRMALDAIETLKKLAASGEAPFDASPTH